MYQVILANYDFTFIDGGEFNSIEEAKNYINVKLRIFSDSINC